MQGEMSLKFNRLNLFLTEKSYVYFMMNDKKTFLIFPIGKFIFIFICLFVSIRQMDIICTGKSAI